MYIICFRSSLSFFWYIALPKTATLKASSHGVGRQFVSMLRSRTDHTPCWCVYSLRKTIQDLFRIYQTSTASLFMSSRWPYQNKRHGTTVHQVGDNRSETAGLSEKLTGLALCRLRDFNVKMFFARNTSLTSTRHLNDDNTTRTF